MNDRTLSTVMTVGPSVANVKLNPPDSDGTFFWTAGRMISYNKPNKNGLVFFKQDCEPVLGTLKSSLANIGHLKKGNNVTSPIPGIDHVVCGAISDYVSDDEGIDILVKNERQVINEFGFSEEDFKPIEGKYSTYSQESDFSPVNSPWITVPKEKASHFSPSDIVDEYPYEQGVQMRLKSSYYDATTGSWKYAYDPKGNVVFVRLRPSAFAGVAHVMHPADETAAIYSYAASIEGEKVISALYPRIDSESATAEEGRNLSEINKEPSSNMAQELKDLFPHIDAELAELREKARTLSTDNSAVAQERDALKTQVETLTREFSEFKDTSKQLTDELQGKITTLEGEVKEKETALAEHAKRELSAQRLAELEKIHPYKDEEKTEDFVKSLSEVSEDRFETLMARREIVKLQAETKGRTLSSVSHDSNGISPAPSFEFGGETVDVKKLNPSQLFI
jgi:FtsZ-binding cell division protein ZapB